MQLGDLLVGVFLKFNSDGVGVMQRLSTTTQAANDKLAFQNKLIDRNELAMRNYQRRIEAARVGWMNLGTAAAGALAIAGGAAITYGVNGAAQMQRALTSTAIALHVGTSNASMQNLYRMAFRVSGMTAQDSLTIANEMAMATTSGLNNQKDLLDAFPRIAKAADVLMMSPKHIDPVEAVKQMSTLSHLFGQYRGAGFQHMLDRATEMMYVQPEGLQQLITQGRLFLPAALGRGVSEEDIFKQAMTMGQTGFLRSRGGSGLANVLEILGGSESLTGHLSKYQHKGLRDLGLTQNNVISPAFYQHGHLLLSKVVDHLEHLRNSMDPGAFSNALSNAFQKQGGRYMLDILLPNIYQKAQENWKRMNELGGVDTMWHQYTNNFLYQFNIFTTNFSNLFKVVFLPMLPSLTTLFMDMGKALGHAVSFLADHPGVAKAIAETIMALTGLAAFRVGAGVIGAAGKVLGLFNGIEEGMPILAKFGTLLDNVFFLGMGKKVLPWIDRFGGAVLGLNTPLSTATKGLQGLLGPLSKVASIVGVFVGTTSFMPQDAARANLISQYGYDYYRYLKGRHPGTNPYSFDRGEGDMDPITYRKLHPLSHRKKMSERSRGGVHIHGNVIAVLPKGSSEHQAAAFVRSLTGQQGNIKTVATVPWGNFSNMGWSGA